MAVAAKRLPALEDRLLLVQAVEARRDVGAFERRELRERLPLTAWQEPKPQRSHCGLPVGQDHGGGRYNERGFDPAKKVEGRKRHLLVDTEGMVLKVKVHSAKVPDQDGLRVLLESARTRFSRLKHLWVDAGYQGRGTGGGPKRYWA